MISYTRLWKLLESKDVTSYYLRNKCGEYNINGSTYRRLKAGESVSTHTIDALCTILKCNVEDIIEHVPDDISV